MKSADNSFDKHRYSLILTLKPQKVTIEGMLQHQRGRALPEFSATFSKGVNFAISSRARALEAFAHIKDFMPSWRLVEKLCPAATLSETTLPMECDLVGAHIWARPRHCIQTQSATTAFPSRGRSFSTAPKSVFPRQTLQRQTLGIGAAKPRRTRPRHNASYPPWHNMIPPFGWEPMEFCA